VGLHKAHYLLFHFVADLNRVRAAIEDDYAKRLAKLAKLALGKDEIGWVFANLPISISTQTALLYP
jgi:hypothetical protein